MTETQTTSPKIWTILSLLNWSTNYLTEKEFESPRLNAELLLCYAFGYQRVELYTNFDKPLLEKELAHFKSLLKRRLAYEPIQYITGECEFMGLPFTVDRRVLIPRPETEILTEEVMKLSQESPTIKMILDIGTGSGNIAVCLAKHFRDSHIISIDVSIEAHEVAKQNIQRHQVGERVRLVLCNFLTHSDMLDKHSFDIIVSNPPYISQEEFLLLAPEVKDFEPSIATTDNADGLTFYKAIAKYGKELLSENGWVFVEMAYNQANTVRQIFIDSNYNNISTVKDYSGIERVLKVQVS